MKNSRLEVQSARPQKGKKFLALSFSFAILALGFALSSCGSDTSSGSTATLTGTVNIGTITNIAANVTAKSGTAASGYTVVVMDNASNKAYHATTGSDGAFSVDVASGNTYLFSIINNGFHIGPIIFDGSGTELYTAITPSVNTNLGSITVDETNGYARTTTVSTSTNRSAKASVVNASVTCNAVNSVPACAGNEGKTVQSGVTNRSDSDMDKDCCANLFDADENNSGIRTGVASAAITKTVVSSYISQVYMTSNIWKEHGSAATGSTQPEIAAHEIALRLHVVPVAGQEAMISSVQCAGVPSSISSVATVRWAESLGNPSGYPTEGSLWSAAGYGLYRTTDTVQFPQEEWLVSIKPVGVMNVGDTFTIRVTYTDSTSEDFYVILPYVLTDWSKISTYDGTTLTSTVGTKVSGNQAQITNNTVTIVFTKPVDEDGNILAGATYSVRYGESNCSSGTCSVPTTITEVSVTDTGADTLSYAVPTPTVGTTYYITPTAEMGDQRNGEETWFIR